jgi:hypothetical protein
MELKEYLIKDYELKVRFLTDHFTRMWTRFNFFLVTETAIVSGRIIFTKSDQTSMALLFTGLVVSILWYLKSAEDKFLVDTYRAEIKETFRQLKEENGFESELDKPLYHVGQVQKINLKRLGVKISLFSWRVNAISRHALDRSSRCWRSFAGQAG